MISEERKWFKWGLKLGISIAASIALGPVTAFVTGAAIGSGAWAVRECVEDEEVREILGFVVDCGKNVAISGMTGGAASAGVSTVVPVFVGAGTGSAVAKLAQTNIEDEKAKKVLGFVSECGFDVSLGIIAGGVGRKFGVSAGKEVFRGTAEKIGEDAEKVVGKIAGQWAAEEIAKGGSKEVYSELARAVTKKAAKEAKKEVLNLGKEVGKKVIEEIITPTYELFLHNKHINEGIRYVGDCPICKEA